MEKLCGELIMCIIKTFCGQSTQLPAKVSLAGNNV